MGVAFGRFLPSDAYADVKSEIVGTYGNQEHLELTASTAAGRPIQCIAIGINDQSVDLGPEELFIEILEVPYPDFEEIFPEHVAAYKKLFPD